MCFPNLYFADASGPLVGAMPLLPVIERAVPGIAVSPPSTLEPLPLDAHTILLFAIEELDAFISELFCAGSLFISANFHDWVADSLTIKIEERLCTALQTSRFRQSLRLGNVRTVIGHWVRYWACMEIKEHFGQYVQFCPCAKASSARRDAVTAAPVPSAENGSAAREGLAI